MFKIKKCFECDSFSIASLLEIYHNKKRREVTTLWSALPVDCTVWASFYTAATFQLSLILLLNIYFCFWFSKQLDWTQVYSRTHTLTEELRRKGNYFYTFHGPQTSKKVGQRLVNSWWTGTVCMTDVLWLEENKWIFYICSWSQSGIQFSQSQQIAAACCISSDCKEERADGEEQPCVYGRVFLHMLCLNISH